MPQPLVSKAHTIWNGSLTDGSGKVSLDSSGLATFDISWKARSEAHNGTTTPEELIAAAHSACFSMALSNGLAQNDTPPQELHTSADVAFVAGEGITGITLNLLATVEGLDEAKFQEIAADAKTNCPVSQALAGVDITLKARLA
ncbi:OsmC family peroxiredoxin [Saxibacter everestensis]|uniref:OsmC family peroxiredoxin n=1 Tax=Saxibacter everestensis TaxID=2909229 RepID=A0ABY8R015_9MICO|nr:OsmC family peroxiredoxin [Brevibacteriaceae bacterium ZFBP1038]